MFRIRERIALVHLHQPALTSVAARLPLPDPALLHFFSSSSFLVPESPVTSPATSCSPWSASASHDSTSMESRRRNGYGKPE
ncbi:hypothetical protein BCR44DRAFT_1432422 [Catenaria anguillulae PL171]|uniref:Uncharacterized protein n=1 Tax=Catenaria anguillulae PL171 TaxID=765915 RepID=A0A1Y2HP00_9FUNG|nr:hypothetical protein BCR44DRAFT_1432422 [Catenaria anguillulae PL171]